MSKLDRWKGFAPDAELEAYRKAGFGERIGFGAKTALLNIASAFFATPLESFLRYDGIDTLVVCGVSTSGCVRGAVEDAFSHNFRVIVVEQACGDRSPSAHRANLFDMDMKFADVEDLDFVVDHLKRLK